MCLKFYIVKFQLVLCFLLFLSNESMQRVFAVNSKDMLQWWRLHVNVRHMHEEANRHHILRTLGWAVQKHSPSIANILALMVSRCQISMYGVLFGVSTLSKRAIPLSPPDRIVPAAQQREKVRQSIRENEMRWTFVCLTGNIQPVSFSVSETVVSASKHYCQANVWWKHTDFPSPCQPHGSFFADSLFNTRSRPGKPARVQGAA